MQTATPPALLRDVRLYYIMQAMVSLRFAQAAVMPRTVRVFVSDFSQQTTDQGDEDNPIAKDRTLLPREA